MSNKFTYDDHSFKQKFKKALPFVGIGALALTVLAILILPSRIANIGKCEDLGLGGGIGTVFTGSCAKSFDEIVFVVGDTQNSPAPTLNYPEYIDTALNLGRADISAISVSNSHRNPKTIADHDDFKKTKDFVNATTDYLEQMKAKDNGADYLEAIQTAADSVEDKSKALIYVIGSGLSDQGLLNFADNGILYSDSKAESIADQVASYIDDNVALKGITIVWDGLGQVTAPQLSLDETAKKKLKDIYDNLFHALGASKSNVRFKNKLNSENSVETNATIKPTPTDEKIIDWGVSFSADTTFAGNSATFTNQVDTESVADEIASKAIEHPSAKITVTAYMSRGYCGRQDIDQDLLNARLAAINNLLTSRGIDASRISLILGGFGDAPECDEAGNYIEVEAAKNRRVDVNVKN